MFLVYIWISFFLKNFFIHKIVFIFVGYKNLNKVFKPRVISIVEEAIIASRRSHARTVRPRQWHVTRGGHTIEKEFLGGG